METCFFCHRPCGERRFCDETCYQEYEEEMKCFLESIKEEYPVGDTGEWSNEEWDVVGGL